MRTARTLVLCLLPSIASAQTLQSVQILHQFTSSPGMPAGALVQVPDGSFYGVTADAIYRVAPGGSPVTIAARLTGMIGANGALVRGPDGALYGVASWGGAGGQGTVFRFDPATGEVRTLHHFTGFNEGSSPVGGLALLGGQLYGVTNSTVFRTDPASGATTILRLLSEAGLASPTGGLTVGADGMLYGVAGVSPFPPGQGTIYRVDPGPGAVTIVHEFTDLAVPNGRLLLGPDGRLYGSALIGRPTGQGGVFRYAPATDTYEVLYAFPESTTTAGPGPVTMTPDGSLYGTTSGPGSVTTLENRLFRLRASGGSYVYEALRPFDVAVDGSSERVELATGADGLLYGFAERGGPANAGTIYRFDPAAGGPVSNPLSFTVLHAFVPATTWGPSAPALGPDGRLSGTTSAGGASQHGAVYVLDPATGVVTIGADVPGAIPAAGLGVLNSSLAVGADNALYGTSTRVAGTTTEHSVLRFVPGSGVVSKILNPSASGAGAFDSAPVKAPSGDLYYARDRFVFRVRTNGTVTPAGSGPDPGTNGFTFPTAPVLGGDGQIYVGMLTFVFQNSPLSVSATSRVFRVNPAADVLDQVADLGLTLLLSGLAAAPGGGLYVSGLSEIRRLDTATGSHTAVCASPDIRSAQITPIDGRIAGVTNEDTQHLIVCDPATAAVDVRTLPATIGRIRGPLVAVGSVLYGATWDAFGVGPGRDAGPAPYQPGGALIRLVLSGAPPALDSEADGLPNEWETRYGLDPFDATGDDGASGDPDGDGRTNAQELADGTHPRGAIARYFAEGATGPFFRTRLDLANPSYGHTAIAQLRFLTDTGAVVVHDLLVPPGGHASVDPATVPGLAHASFSTVVESDVIVGVDRTMSWDPSGYGSHAETGVLAPATTWYLAEGSTSGPFSLFYLLQNPHATPLTATVRYLRPGGLPPIERTYTLRPNSRTTIQVDAEGADLASTDVSAVITAPSPIVAERAMYYSQPNQVFAAGHESAGVTAPQLEWFLAEGATGAFFDLFVLIANPNASPAAVEVEYLLIGGGSLTKTYTVPADGRSTVWVDDEQLPAGSGTKPLADAALSMVVRSTNGVPIVVERTMWWPGPALTPNFWYEAHNSPGATTTATRWVVAGGAAGGPTGAQTYILIANPGSTPAQVVVSGLSAFGPSSPVLYNLPPKSRTNVEVFNFAGSPEGGVLVESIGTTPVPVVVEYATYGSPGGMLWASGGNALATPLP